MLSEEFSNQIEEIVAISERENLNEWQICNSAGDVKYLEKKNHKISFGDELFNFNYHVVYHPSYMVPMLCFNAWDSSGRMITDYDQIWTIFKANLPLGYPESMDLYSILTQIDHPVLQTPVWACHPCKTPELLASLSSSNNKVLSIMSTFGPVIGLSLDLCYAKYLDERINSSGS